MSLEEKIRHYSLYIIFGVITTVVNLVVFRIFLEVGLHYTVSATIAFVIAVLTAYYTNKTWVFGSRTKGVKDVWKELISFFSARIFTYFVDIAGLLLLVEGLEQEPFLSKLLMNIVVVVLNYILSRWVVFKARQEY
ncbi:Putative flippase GtrA (transmembrane translocase of bactoprenol-linked glucose) [Tindallia magadiensis]|uniref:Putative flippase GtrA (Transmembrane translocase of bactoprenol-linked glucose) n=1 Tax=Tindallia magadiensis TaxID=69895 RepID=A0A1I3DWS9_9FIRM|nr:GtrA family protein [Tindallia magadiensis]SFH91204.1 Putative flippase GtrA (transmembrane translocase of bactoprenol-linked glucose) [Tindallia magadiensis]